VIGCSCKVCSSSNPKDKRLRTSALVRYDQKNYLIDCGPDARIQALSHHIDRLDALIVTHTHFDHIGGLEELRIYNFYHQKPIECLLSKESFDEVQQLFFYLFQQHHEKKNYTSQFAFHPVSEHCGEMVLAGLPVRYFSYYQGDMKVLGVRFGDLAYMTDIKSFTDDVFQFLDGISTLVISALRFTPSHLHLTIDEAVDFVSKTTAKNSYFIHLSHEIEHNHVASLLPEGKGVHLAYDGLQIPFRI